MKLFFTFFIALLINSNLFEYLPIYSDNIEERDFKKKFSFKKYTLGTGDRLSIKVFMVDNFNAEVTILPDGSINLPRIGRVLAKDKTINELEENLIQKYKKILKNPIVYVDLQSTRPIRVTITGEVSRPGIYTLDTSENSQISNADGGEASSINSRGWPTVIEAIQKAGGVKTDSNIKKIKLRRGLESLNIDLWSPLKSGELVNNPLLFDGDSIFIPLAQKQTYDENYKISSSSFSPSNITVNVIGEVKNPGKVKLLANSPITKSIYLAGGFTFRANKSYADLIRLNKNGSINKTRHHKIFEDSESNLNNVLLKDGDVVLINRTFLSKTTDSLKNITQPFEPLLDIRTLYRILN